MSDVVLGWIQSILTKRVQQVSFNGQLSSKQSLLLSVPQGFVLGSLLYILYTTELEQLILHHGLHSHQYADDSQVCQRANQRCTGSLSQLRRLHP